MKRSKNKKRITKKRVTSVARVTKRKRITKRKNPSANISNISPGQTVWYRKEPYRVIDKSKRGVEIDYNGRRLGIGYAAISIESPPTYVKYWIYSFIIEGVSVYLYIGTFLNYYKIEIPNMFRYGIDFKNQRGVNVKESIHSPKGIFFSSQNEALKAALVSLKRNTNVTINDYRLVPDNIYIDKL